MGLKPATSYTVTAVATNSKGAATTEVTHFTTKSAARVLQISSITPDSGETVGVGMPIIVDFNYDVARSDRAAVEHALEVVSDVPVTGAWFWASDSEVVFRTQRYSQAHEHVLLTAHLTGVPGGPGLWGGGDLSRSFTIGDSHVVKVNLRTDHARFYTNGSLARKIPVSGGMGGYNSCRQRLLHHRRRHLTMGSYNSVWMTSPNIKPGQPGYYHEIVYNDVQISDSGEYLHQSPGGLWCLGVENCSHGCVRMTADGAAWWRHTAYRGDPVTVTGSPRVLAWDNGWGYWQKSWPAWLKGSSAGPVTTTALARASLGIHQAYVSPRLRRPRLGLPRPFMAVGAHSSRRLDHPEFLGGCDLWESWDSCNHGSSTLLSCGNARWRWFSSCVPSRAARVARWQASARSWASTPRLSATGSRKRKLTAGSGRAPRAMTRSASRNSRRKCASCGGRTRS